MALRSTIVCDRCGDEQEQDTAPTMIAMLDTPKKPRQVWHLCAACVPIIVAALEKPAPPQVVEGQPEDTA